MLAPHFTLHSAQMDVNLAHWIRIHYLAFVETVSLQLYFYLFRWETSELA